MILVSIGEVIKGKFALEVTKINKEISKIEEKETDTTAIGFVIPEDEEKGEEYYEDED